METTKEVTYEGQLWTVPERTRFMARDINGNVCCFQFAPTLHYSGFWEPTPADAVGGRYAESHRAPFRDSLAELP